jgi:adhesin transport system outer membrane protein
MIMNSFSMRWCRTLCKGLGGLALALPKALLLFLLGKPFCARSKYGAAFCAEDGPLTAGRLALLGRFFAGCSAVHRGFCVSMCCSRGAGNSAGKLCRCAAVWILGGLLAGLAAAGESGAALRLEVALDVSRMPPARAGSAPVPAVSPLLPAGLVPVGSAHAAGLSLPVLLAAVEDAHPALRSARLQARAAEQNVAAVQRQRWPSVGLVLESAASGGSGASASTRQLRLEQALWDFGRVSSLVAESRAQAGVSQTQLALARQDLLLQAVQAWQQLLGGLGRERVAQRALVLLQGYRSQMQRRVDAGASAPIDLELVEARVLQAQADVAAASSMVQQASSRLEQLSGLGPVAPRVQGLEVAQVLVQALPRVQRLLALDVALLASEHPAVQRARQELEVLNRRLDAKKAEQWPQLYLRLDQPLDRVAGQPSTSTRIFVGLRYVPAAGLAGQAEVQSLATRLEGQAFAADTAQREVLQALLADREELLSASARLEGLQLSVASARAVQASYQRQFEAARKSWLDLLNTVRDLSSSEYALAEAQVALLGALSRLQLRLGAQVDEF